jgi:cytochrome bd-type quinol oxidase subunit 2
MNQATRYAFAALAALLLVIGIYMLIQQWMRREELELAVPCTLLGFGGSLFCVGMFWPEASAETDSCTNEDAFASSETNSGDSYSES